MSLIGTTNISTTLVKNTIGAATNAIGALCTHVNINKWSKYKPIEYNKNVGLDDADFATAQYGIIIQEMSDVKNTQGKTWFYTKPNTYGRRIGDFRNYYHLAPVPLIQNKGTTFSVNRFASIAQAIGFTILQATSGYEAYCLTIALLTPENGNGVLLNNYYLACAIYNSSNTLVGTYYSYNKINYNAVNQSGATIQLSNSPEFNSADAYIENYTAGSYTIYLYITDYALNIPIGGIRKYYPVNYTTTYPQTINLSILGLNDICNVAFEGIRPTGGVWGDSSTDYKKGNISQAVRGTYTRFHAKYTFYNITAQKIYIPKSQVFLYYNQITSWGGTVGRAYQAVTYALTNIEIEANSNVVAYFEYITPLPYPSSVPTTNGSLTLDPHVHYGNNDSGEQFYDTVSTALTLYYEP